MNRYIAMRARFDVPPEFKSPGKEVGRRDGAGKPRLGREWVAPKFSLSLSEEGIRCTV